MYDDDDDDEPTQNCTTDLGLSRSYHAGCNTGCASATIRNAKSSAKGPFLPLSSGIDCSPSKQTSVLQFWVRLFRPAALTRKSLHLS